MAKYDVCKLTYHVEQPTGDVKVEISVLFDDGDVVENVISDVCDRVQARVGAIKLLTMVQ